MAKELILHYTYIYIVCLATRLHSLIDDDLTLCFAVMAHKSDFFDLFLYLIEHLNKSNFATCYQPNIISIGTYLC